MNFRRWITALTMLVLFAGLAAAQTGGSTALQCTTIGQVTPTIRSEGVTELIGDIVISCTGGQPLAEGALVPQVNISVSLPYTVTSRATGVYSEALLIVDEANSLVAAPVNNFGPLAALTLCTTPLQGCLAYARGATVNTAVPGGPAQGSTIMVSAAQQTGTASTAANVYQGLVSGQTVSFLGVPVLPPGTTGITRVLRITNIRINATTAGAGAGGVQAVNAFISTNPTQSLPISTGNTTVAFVAPSLTVSVTDKPSQAMTQCDLGMNALSASASLNKNNVAILNFTELFPTAFKTRVTPFNTTAGSSYTATGVAQNVPTQTNGSESGFILPGVTNGATTGTTTFTAGRADTGTRLKAVFANLPAGATLWVSRYNVAGYSTAATQPDCFGCLATPPQIAKAALTKGTETGAFDLATATPTIPYGATDTNLEAIPIYTPSSTGGTATAVWEVINTNLNMNETFKFAVYLTYAPGVNTPTLTPSTGGPQVTLSYAPITTGSNIPRFILGTASVPYPIINIVPCRTLLLFPYVTTLGGFDTGIAISNTSKDPVGTTTSGGSCKLYFYGGDATGAAYTQPTTPLTVGPIEAGTPDPRKAAFQASSVAPNFQGYMFAMCDFQFAHGFAFVSDIGARNLAMGYLALVVNNGKALNLRGEDIAGEALDN